MRDIEVRGFLIKRIAYLKDIYSGHDNRFSLAQYDPTEAAQEAEIDTCEEILAWIDGADERELLGQHWIEYSRGKEE